MENPELSSEVQSLKKKLDEHSKQLEKSAEKLNQLESENLTLRDENQALNTASNKKRRFRSQIRPMPTLETPNSGGDTTRPLTTSNRDREVHEKAKGTQTYDVEDSESESEPDKEVLQEARHHAIHGGKAPRGSSPDTEKQSRLLRQYSFHGGDHLD
ncbi:hypothetical protein DY000_02007355 [Brassica cretica]|uniref:Shugoshin C-terminal domain-containing protein n=1 Tax=Brassica cretica TaxID=69181 RepID=A0ABQ7CBK3_BRACR|nr:hypothetical protein DY000_02007355 [Brassica cretica]